MAEAQNSKLKVLIVSEPGVDGVFRHVESLYRFLNSNNVGVDLLYSSNRSSDGMFELVKRIVDTGGKCSDLMVSGRPSARDFFAFVKILSWILRKDYSLVHAHSSKAGFLVRLVCLLLRRSNILYTPHAFFGMAYKGSLSERFFNSLEIVLRDSSDIIVISSDEKKFAVDEIGVSENRIHQIHNPVRQCLVDSGDKVTIFDARQQLDLPRESILIGIVGRQSAQKQPFVLYDALSKSGRNFKIVHLAPEGQFEELRQQARACGLGDRVMLRPYMENVEVFYRSLDYFVVSSAYEAGLPLVLLEALALGLPCAVSNCPGVGELSRLSLSHCKLFEPGDSLGLADILMKEVTHSRLSPASRSNHAETVRQGFSEENQYGKTLKLYSKMKIDNTLENRCIY